MNPDLPTFRTTNSLKQDASTVGLIHSDRSEILSHRGLTSSYSQKPKLEHSLQFKSIELASSGGVSPIASAKGEKKKTMKNLEQQ